MISLYESTQLRLVASYFGDGNLDGMVDGLDYLVWAGNYGNEEGDDPADDPPSAPQNGDYNNDGLVDGLDYLTWAGNYEQSIFGPGTTTVPEPAAWLLLAMGWVAIAKTRIGRRRERIVRKPSQRG